LIRPVRVLLTGSAFAAFGVGTLLLACVGLPVAWLAQLAVPAGERLSWRQRRLSACCRAFVGYMRLCRLIRFTPPVTPPWLPEGPCVIVANHPSLIDVLVVLSTLPHLQCVVQASWFRYPLVARVIQAGGHFSGPAAGAGELSGGTAGLDAITARLRGGASVLIFPEGTRSPEGGLRRFRKGPAAAAIGAGVPIAPLRLRFEPSTLRKGQRWYEVPDRTVDVSLEFLPVVDPSGGDVGGVTRELRALYGP
jgi:1-acyl-sn-glycerol-3-phosphate acyltransferase